MRILIRTAVNVVGLYVASLLVDTMSFADDSLITLIIVAVLFGLVNAFIRPIVRLFTFPLTIITLGLFTFVVNAIMLLIVGMTPWLNFEGNFIQMFISALFASLIISIVSVIASWLLPDSA